MGHLANLPPDTKLFLQIYSSDIRQWIEVFFQTTTIQPLFVTNAIRDAMRYDATNYKLVIILTKVKRLPSLSSGVAFVLVI